MRNQNLADGNSAHILVVDDDDGVRDVIQQQFQRTGFVCSAAASGGEAIHILDAADVDVVVTDVRMPGMNGIELTQKIRSDYGADAIVMTGYNGSMSYEGVIELGAADFVQKPCCPSELAIRVKRVLRERQLVAERETVNQELQSSNQKLRRTLQQTVSAMTATIEMRDPYTSGHQRRVTHLACAIAEELHLSDDTIDGLRIAGLLHDIGKISVPSEILSKPGKLTDAEFSLLKQHPQVGYDILKGIEFPWPVARIMVQHHERLDGTGYPGGLLGDEILLEAKILSVADVVEAMSSHRPYRAALGIEIALEEITQNSAKLYDPTVVDACVRLFTEKKFSLV